MYILFEGMPCTGKTTLAKSLAVIIGGVYHKSVISESELGKYLKVLREVDIKTLEYFYLIDNAIDELRINDILDSTAPLIRDKCFVSSMAHIMTHGFENNKELYSNAIWESYKAILAHSPIPDLVVLMEPDFEKINDYIWEKKDTSTVDQMLISDKQRYLEQHTSLKSLLHDFYGEKVICIKSFSMPIEQLCDHIINEYHRLIRL